MLIRTFKQDDIEDLIEILRLIRSDYDLGNNKKEIMKILPKKICKK